MSRIYSRFRNFVSDVISGIGSDEDPGSRYSFSTQRENFTNSEIIAAYTNSGQIQRAIDLLPVAASRFIYKNDDGQPINIDIDIEVELKRLNLRSLFMLASISARLFKESYLMLITDHDDYTAPISNKEKLIELLPLETDQLTFKENSGDREYTLRLNTGNFNFNEQIVHSSRILMFAGKYLPPKIRSAYHGYHASVIGGIMMSYGNYRHGLNISMSLLSRMSTFILKLAGLQSYIQSSDSSGLSNRLNMLKRFIGSIGGFIIDAESEELEWLQLQLNGISEIIKLHARQLTAETDLSHDQLWNEGSSVTASALEEINFNKRVEAFLAMHWQDNFNRVYEIITDKKSDVLLGVNENVSN